MKSPALNGKVHAAFHNRFNQDRHPLRPLLYLGSVETSSRWTDSTATGFLADPDPDMRLHKRLFRYTCA